MMTLLRRAFGFSPDSEEEEEDYDPTVPTYAAGDSRQAQARERLWLPVRTTLCLPWLQLRLSRLRTTPLFRPLCSMP